MRLLKKDDTSKAIVFLMVDSTDHITGKTGLTPTITISKNGGTFASPSGTVSEIGNGWYKFTPAAADVDTLGPLLIHATATGADPVDIEYQVVAFDPYAATNLGLSNLDTTVSSRSSHTAADVWSVTSRTITGGTVDTLTDKTGFELSAAGVDAIWDEPRTGHTTAGTFGYYIDAAISSRSNHAPADVWAYTTRTLTASIDPTAAQIADAVWDELRSEHTTTGTYGKTSEWTDSSDPATIADAVWDEAQSGHTTAGTFGAYLNAAITSRSSHSAADVWNVASRTVTGGTIDTLNDRTGFQLSAAGIDAIWDEPQSGHTTEGTFGHYLDAQVSSRATPAQAADAVWDEPRAGHTTDGTYGAVDEWASVSTFGPDDIANAVWDEARAEHTETGTFGAVDEWARVYTGTQVVVQPLTAMPQSAVAAGGRIRAIADTTFACMIRVDATVLALTGAHFIYWNDKYPAVDIPPERVMLSEQEDGTTVVHVEAPAIYVQNPGEFTYYIYVPSSDRVFVEGKLTIAASKGV